MQARIESVIVVEDSVLQRAHMAGLCKSAGIELVYEASNGCEALEILSLLVLPPTLMIVDLEMPSMDGIELIEELDKRAMDIPVIIVSSREHVLIQSAETTGRAMGVRVLAALQKPLRSADLQGAIHRLGTPPGAPAAKVDPQQAHFTPQDLARAIDDGQIFAHYQPKVDVISGCVRGVEVLARWTHPVAGNIAPDRFIGLAEREGLICRLTFSIMGQAMAQAARWNSQGLQLSTAINLSPTLLKSPTLVGDIAALVKSHGLAATQIVLEITETGLVSDLASALASLVRLRLKGFGLSIDDYGTGFSSMQQLARVPFTELKIDRSFVHGAHLKGNLRVILKSALDMSRQLGLCSVAEGIETMQDWRLLQEVGCMVGQGYLIAKPMPAERLPQWLEEHQVRLPGLQRAGSLVASRRETAAIAA